METILKAFKELSKDCIEFAISIKQPQGHTDLCNGISIYMNNGSFSMTFNKESYTKTVKYTFYTNKISFPIDFTEVDLQEVLSKSTTTFLEFKASDLTERIKKNVDSNTRRIDELKKELEILENTNQ